MSFPLMLCEEFNLKYYQEFCDNFVPSSGSIQLGLPKNINAQNVCDCHSYITCDSIPPTIGKCASNSIYFNPCTQE